MKNATRRVNQGGHRRRSAAWFTILMWGSVGMGTLGRTEDAPLGATLAARAPRKGFCQNEVIENRFLNCFMGLRANVDPVMGHFGMGFIVTAHGRPDDIKKIREEAATWVKDHRALPKDPDALICDHCRKEVTMVREGRIQYEAFPFEHGVVALLTGKTLEDARQMHRTFQEEMKRKRQEQTGRQDHEAPPERGPGEPAVPAEPPR